MGEKNLFEAYLLALTPLGFLGGLHFYLGRPHMGVLYLCTLGVFGVGYLVDIVRTPFLVKEANMKYLHKKDPTQPLPAKKSVIDAYLTWFPLGIFGLHHLYLKRSSWALLHMVTAGLFIVGWVVDAFWMVSMVRECNRRLEDPEYKKQKELKKAKKEKDKESLADMANDIPSPSSKDTALTTQDQDKKSKATDGDDKDGKEGKIKEKEMRAAVALSLSPLGLFGAHHFYLKRSTWGLLYSVSLGLVGIGWIADWIRIAFLTRRANSVLKGERDGKEKTLDDAYVLWFPWGLFGLHHFYLGRPQWGFLYLLTAGAFVFGWLLDGIRMPMLVKESNQRRISHESTLKADDVEANITPAADDYDDNTNSLTLNIPENEDENNDDNAGKSAGQEGEKGESKRTKSNRKEAESGTEGK